MRTRLNQRGFTLIEILTVVVIIGILAGILFKIGPLVNRRAAHSLTANRLEQLKLCIEGYYRVYGEYPRATGVTWEEPEASARKPEDWGIILPKAREKNPEWENPDKQYWNKLYPYIYRDSAAAEWTEFSVQAGGGGAGAVAHTNVNSVGLGFEYGTFSYTNLVHSIHDGYGNAFSYRSVEPYQSYDLSASDDIGKGWTE